MSEAPNLADESSEKDENPTMAATGTEIKRDELKDWYKDFVVTPEISDKEKEKKKQKRQQAKKSRQQNRKKK